jgi:hypothetical protein
MHVTYIQFHMLCTYLGTVTHVTYIDACYTHWRMLHTLTHVTHIDACYTHWRSLHKYIDASYMHTLTQVICIHWRMLHAYIDASHMYTLTHVTCIHWRMLPICFRLLHHRLLYKHIHKVSTSWISFWPKFSDNTYKLSITNFKLVSMSFWCQHWVRISQIKFSLKFCIPIHDSII